MWKITSLLNLGSISVGTFVQSELKSTLISNSYIVLNKKTKQMEPHYYAIKENRCSYNVCKYKIGSVEPHLQSIKRNKCGSIYCKMYSYTIISCINVIFKF